MPSGRPLLALPGSYPLVNFTQAFKNVAAFRWTGEVRYLGVFIPSTALPWHYTVIWMLITIPLFYSVLFFLGVLATGRQILTRRLKIWQGSEELQDLIFLGLFSVPMVAIIICHSVLYDGWRQMYFVYRHSCFWPPKGGQTGGPFDQPARFIRPA